MQGRERADKTHHRFILCLLLLLSSRHAFIEGEAGCGKTVFCLHVLNIWRAVKQSGMTYDDELRRCLSLFDLVFYVPSVDATKGFTGLPEICLGWIILSSSVQQDHGKYHSYKTNIIWDITAILLKF